MSESQPFKYYYGAELAQQLAGRIQTVYPSFDAGAFVARIAGQVESLELKARVSVIAAALREYLPPAYPEALDILRSMLGPELTDEQGMFNEGYHLMPVAHFVEIYGIEDFDASLPMLYEITKRFSSEFAIRPFLVRYPARTLDLLHQWAHDANPHVRRLVSEGTRTRLPWATRLRIFIDDPAPVLALLEHLRDDPSAYVRKSVANNLNDLMKDHRDLVLALLTRWHADASPERMGIIRHALRNLVKQGDPEALRLLAVDAPRVTLARLDLSHAGIRLGETLTLTLELHSDSPADQEIIVDYAIHFVKANGKTQPKVFKLRTLTLPARDTLTLRKQHALKPVTTRRYYAGRHRLDVQVNGVVLGGADFDLLLNQEST
jgi:3-methyladenine DNA glycosylase AlkC